jgi:tetratricopeptide (TPR) repeat protein
LVCNQAIALNPEYGPIYHALGLILLEKNELVNALKAFEKAFQKDKKLFASYMNYAAINLSFRGYESAKIAFGQAIALNPDSYDAHIGLGVALRGLGDYVGAKAEYQKASNVNPKKTDYIFNLGLLAMDYTNSGDVEGFRAAKKVFKEFVSKANRAHKVDPDGKKGAELSWVAKARDRIKKCNKNVKMIIAAEREMAELEKLAKVQAKREAEMKARMEKAKKLEQKEASGAVAPGDGKEAE